MNAEVKREIANYDYTEMMETMYDAEITHLDGDLYCIKSQAIYTHVIDFYRFNHWCKTILLKKYNDYYKDEHVEMSGLYEVLDTELEIMKRAEIPYCMWE